MKLGISLITSSTLLNLKEIKPSFEELNDNNETVSTKKNLKEKKKK